MSPEEQKYYETYFDLFTHAGFKQLQEEYLHNSKSIDSVEKARDLEDLMFRKGQLSVIATLLNLPDTINMAYTELQEREQENLDND